MALKLTLKKGKRVLINRSVLCEVEEVSGNSVKLSFDYGHSDAIVREEVYEKAKENGSVMDLYDKGWIDENTEELFNG